MPQLCRLAEALGEGPRDRQREGLCHLLSCLRLLAEVGLADEAVRAGGGRLLATTTAAFLVSISGAPRPQHATVALHALVAAPGGALRVSNPCCTVSPSHRLAPACAGPPGGAAHAARRSAGPEEVRPGPDLIPHAPALGMGALCCRPARCWLGRHRLLLLLLKPWPLAYSVALRYPSLWVALVSGGTVEQLLVWAAGHLQARWRMPAWHGSELGLQLAACRLSHPRTHP